MKLLTVLIGLVSGVGYLSTYSDKVDLEGQVKIKPKIVYVTKIIPCDSNKYYHEGFEAGKKVNWHFSKKNIVMKVLVLFLFRQ